MDDRYLAGPLSGVPGAWVMSGCCVGGLSVSPARFAGRNLDEADLREQCRHAYATHYRASSGEPPAP